MEQMIKIWNRLMIHEPVITLITIVLWAFILLVFNHLVIKFAQKKKFKLNQVHKRFKNGLLMTIFIIVLGMQFKASKDILTTLLASTGILAVVVGLACQEVAANLLAGASIFVSKPYTIGDLIFLKSDDIKGEVIDISFRQTVIKTINNTVMIIPNTRMNTSIIENLSRTNAYAMTPLTFTISYQDDINYASELVKNAVLNHPSLLKSKKDEVKVVVSNWLDSGIELKTFLFTDTAGNGVNMSYDLKKEVKYLFDQNNISIPYPTVTIAK